MMRNALICCFVLLQLAPPALSEQRTIKVDNTVVRKVNDKNAEELELPMATAEDFFIKQKRIVEQMDIDEHYSSFSINIVSKFDTRVKIKWLDKDLLRMNGQEDLRYHLKANQPRGFGFTVYGPSEGILIFMNENDEIIGELPYKVIKESLYSHRVSLGTSLDTGYFGDTRINASYSISRKKQYIDEGTWSLRTRVSGKINNFSDLTIGIQGSYNW